MFKVVNGYVCTSGCDERLAKKDIDPRNPHNDPVKQEQLDQKDPQKAIEKTIEEATESRLEAKRNPADSRSGESRGAAVVFGGSLAAEASRSAGSSGSAGEERRAVPGQVVPEQGALVDVYA